MKIKKLDAHDRFTHFTKQTNDIGQCCQDLIDQRPFGEHAFYIFAHARTEDNDVSKKRIVWQPRLTKPKAQSNSMLFKAYPGSDNIKIIWMLPAPELWEQYKKGLLTENETISNSIYAYETNREGLEARESDDLKDSEIDAVYRQIARAAKKPKLSSLAASLGLSF